MIEKTNIMKMEINIAGGLIRIGVTSKLDRAKSVFYDRTYYFEDRTNKTLEEFRDVLDQPLSMNGEQLGKLLLYIEDKSTYRKWRGYKKT